jgi:hypothetical protein
MRKVNDNKGVDRMSHSVLYEWIFDSGTKLSLDCDHAKKRLTMEVWKANESVPGDYTLEGKSCLGSRRSRRLARALRELKVIDEKA